MSESFTSLCSVLLREYFGVIVEAVGSYLLKQVSYCPMHAIIRNTALPAAKVRSALCVLLQHNFATFRQDEHGIVEYTLKPENILLLLHYERFAYYAHVLYGEPANLLVVEVLNNGKLTMSETIQKVAERLQDTTNAKYPISAIHNKFVQLVTGHFLIRCPYPHPSEEDRAPLLCISEKEEYEIPEIKLHLLEVDNTEESSPKRQKIEYPDSGIYFAVNYERFLQYFRDNVIITACSNFIDEKASDLIKIVLELSNKKMHPHSTTSSPVPHYEILEKISPKMNIQELDAYLALLSESSPSFISKSDDRSGGMYVVNILKVLHKLVESITASVVQDRFGSKCARIFRILLSKKALEAKQIEELAMLQPKDSKEYIYKMFEEGFILSREVPKGSDFSHGQIFYLLHIDLVQVCRMLIERCYQALFNLITYNEKQLQENKRLLEKKERIGAIVDNLKHVGADEEQIEIVQKNITPSEEALIKKLSDITLKTDSGQIQIAEMFLTLTIWLDYSKLK